MPRPQGWSKNNKKFIELLKYYEENIFKGKNYSKDSIVWQNISTKVSLPALYCRRKWLDIKNAYFKLKYLIKIGKVTEDRIRMHRKAAKYFDGRLDFLDQFLSEISDAAICNSAHNFFTSLFGEEAGTSRNNVDAVNKIKFKKNSSVTQVTKDYKKETGTKLMRILPKKKHATEEVYPIDDNSDDAEFVVPVPLQTVILPSIQLNQDIAASSSKRPTKNKEPKVKRESAGCNLAYFLVKYTNTNIEQEKDGDLKEYMYDLAEVLCNRLAPRKRKDFLSQIDLIVSETLEGA